MRLLFFTSPHCVPCHTAKETIRTVDLGDVPVDTIDVEDQPDIAMRYNVRGLPTFVVVDDDGDVHAQHTGLLYASTLKDFVHRTQ